MRVLLILSIKLIKTFFFFSFAYPTFVIRFVYIHRAVIVFTVAAEMENVAGENTLLVAFPCLYIKVAGADKRSSLGKSQDPCP